MNNENPVPWSGGEDPNPKPQREAVSRIVDAGRHLRDLDPLDDPKAWEDKIRQDERARMGKRIQQEVDGNQALMKEESDEAISQGIFLYMVGLSSANALIRQRMGITDSEFLKRLDNMEKEF